MKKVIKCTHIDNGSHGYLSVSKNNILAIYGEDGLKNISQYSGLSFNRVYLEEDSDATEFENKCKELGFELVIKYGYNHAFAIHHNYNHKLFNIRGEIGEKFLMYDNEVYEITQITKNDTIIVENKRGKRYRLLKSNPFKHIKDIAQ